MNNTKKNHMLHIRSFIKNNNMYILFLVLLIACTLLSPDFLTLHNIINLGRQQSGLLIISMGLLFVIMTSGIDLASGAVMALTSVLMTFCLTTHQMSMTVSVLISLLAGALTGFCSGIMVSCIKMAPFIVTLAMQIIARGLAYVISNGNPVLAPPDGIEKLGVGSVGAVPTLVILSALIVGIFYFLQHHTTYGRITLAIGSNEKAVHLAGIRVSRYITAVYAIAGICSAIAGIISVSRTGIGTPQVGSGIETDAIAACVIGGANMMGGEGSVLKTVVGVFVLALIRNIMNLLAIPSYPQDIIKGAVIILAVLLQTVTSRKS